MVRVGWGGRENIGPITFQSLFIHICVLSWVWMEWEGIATLMWHSGGGGGEMQLQLITFNKKKTIFENVDWLVFLSVIQILFFSPHHPTPGFDRSNQWGGIGVLPPAVQQTAVLDHVAKLSQAAAHTFNFNWNCFCRLILKTSIPRRFLNFLGRPFIA